jgi:hypothetical protein
MVQTPEMQKSQPPQEQDQQPGYESQMTPAPQSYRERYQQQESLIARLPSIRFYKHLTDRW